ncbi:MAG: isochorismatase family protein [Rhodospirillales bacterium]|nr:isochorismatase family protein [Alphaproteobacteria bacterium]MCB9986446.1 isochorismatase family protein [Rhodospirillales bacterium]USO07008.1 MAG: isochorismatase family protein [Rhodospirillales bacterium]
MIVPQATDARALFIVDVQPLTLTGDIALRITDAIARFTEQPLYQAYIVAEYHAPKSSMMYKQGAFTLKAEETGPSSEAVLRALEPYRKNLFRVHKTTRSCFKGTDPDGLNRFLTQRGIREIHFVGFDINDCVLASAYDAIDMGYYSFVLEELSHHHAGLEHLKESAITIYRRQNMTNNSLIEGIARKRIEDPS